MASTSEIGHAKNVAHLQQLISFCTGYGAAYNPSRVGLGIAGLQALLAQSQLALNNVKSTKATFDNATNNRKETFADLVKFSTQVVSALASSGVSDLAIADAKGYLRKMQGRRAGNNTPAPAAPATLPEGTEDKRISVAQLSFDNQAEHFSKLVETVSLQPNYKPNEAWLNTGALQTKLAALHTSNTGVIDAYTSWSNARFNRNNVFYNPLTGLTQVAADVKLYIKSIFGTTSPQFKQASALRFSNPS